MSNFNEEIENFANSDFGWFSTIFSFVTTIRVVLFGS
jgi:hypothetical protein